MRKSVKLALLVTAGLLVAGAAFVAGWAAAPSSVSHASVNQIGSYFDGLRVGEAQGRMEGRAIQEGIALPPDDRRPVQHAFDAGYAAGMNDAFAGYDGGWALNVPWIVTIEEGSGDIAYRIKNRTPVVPGVEYYLCPDGHSLCQRPR
jgi:hypothetical protein